MVGKAQKSYETRSELNSVFDLEKLIGGTPLEHPSCGPVIVKCKKLNNISEAMSIFLKLYHSYTYYGLCSVVMRKWIYEKTKRIFFDCLYFRGILENT
jgi:hypothetical protein